MNGFEISLICDHAVACVRQGDRAMESEGGFADAALFVGESDDVGTGGRARGDVRDDDLRMLTVGPAAPGCAWFGLRPFDLFPHCAVPPPRMPDESVIHSF